MRFLALLLNSPVIGLLALFAAIVWMMRNDKDRVRPLLVIALTLNLIFGALLTIGMSRENSLFPMKYDYILFLLDKSLGISAGSVAIHTNSALRSGLNVIYALLVPVMVLWVPVTGNRTRRGSVVLAYVAELVVGPMMYALVPACGPVYAFGAEWIHPPIVQPAKIHLAGMPNAFPSLHLATALVLVLFARGGVWRAIALVFFAGTAMATLTTGEHYVIDLFAGLAFGCFAAAVGTLRYRRGLVYLGIALFWSLAVRYEYATLIAHPYVLWILALLTLTMAVTTVVREWRTPECDELPNGNRQFATAQ
jgi:hypothetical protein